MKKQASRLAVLAGILSLGAPVLARAADADPAVARVTFEALRILRDGLAARFGVPLPVLSMGMTGDMEEAIAAGSTIVRVGTALFGDRS